MSLHATICRYVGITGPIDEVMHTGRQLATAVSQVPGFVSYALLDAGHGAIVSIYVFEDRIELEAADQLVRIWAAEHLTAPLTHPPEVTTGEVIVQRGM